MLITFNMALLEEKYQSMNGSKIFRSEKRKKTFRNCFWKNELWWRFSLKISIALEKMEKLPIFQQCDIFRNCILKGKMEDVC